MAIPIKSERKPIEKAKSRTIKSGDDDYEPLRKLACDLFIACQNKSMAYDAFRRMTMGADYSKSDSNTSSASIWFNKSENANYIAVREVEISHAGWVKFNSIKGLTHEEFTQSQEKVYEGLEKQTPTEVREKNYIELERLKETTDDPQILAQIIKQQSELFSAKLKDEGVDATATDLRIIFTLPTKICDTCPKRKEVEASLRKSPEIEAQIEEFIIPYLEDDQD